MDVHNLSTIWHNLVPRTVGVQDFDQDFGGGSKIRGDGGGEGLRLLLRQELDFKPYDGIEYFAVSGRGKKHPAVLHTLDGSLIQSLSESLYHFQVLDRTV